jgi:hypothetical protein
MAAAGTPAIVGTNGVPTTVPPPAQAGTSGPPTISVNGDNPATIAVGSTYVDLGPQITGPQADLNFSIHIFVDGIATDPVVVDTALRPPTQSTTLQPTTPASPQPPPAPY